MVVVGGCVGVGIVRGTFAITAPVTFLPFPRLDSLMCPPTQPNPTRNQPPNPPECQVLSGWPASASQFVKVMPTDYKRVLRQRLEAAGEEEDEGDENQVAISGL